MTKNNINYNQQLKISREFDKYVECLNCRQAAHRFNCPIYGYFYNDRAMDNSYGHSFVCRECWNKTPQWRREYSNWQIFTQEIAWQVEKDWTEKEEGS